MGRKKNSEERQPDKRAPIQTKLYRYQTCRLRDVAAYLSMRRGKKISIADALDIACGEALEEAYLEALTFKVEEQKKHVAEQTARAE